MKPACMTDQEYTDWQARNRECPDPAAAPCSDCPLDWALEQEQRGDCLVFNGADYVLGTPLGDGPLSRREVVRRSALRGTSHIDRENAQNCRMLEAKKLHDDGLTVGRIASNLGVHVCTVRRYIREMRAVA